MGKRDSLEADRVFSVFTKDFGRLEIVGRAIRKIASKLRGGIDIFSFSEIEFVEGKHRKTLTDAVAVKKFKNIVEIPEKMRCAHAISQLADTFIKGQEQDEKILDLLLDAFEKLDSCSEAATQYLLVYHYFFWNFVAILGYGPNFSACASCNEKLQSSQIVFSHEDGGVLCPACGAKKTQAIIISADAVKLLRLIMKREWSMLIKINISGNLHSSIKKIADGYYNYLHHKIS